MSIVVHRVDIHHHAPDLSSIHMELKKMTEALDRLRADVAAENTVIDSAVIMINGISKQIHDAVDAAVAAGAKSSDVAALTALADDVEAKSAALSAAVAANTAPAPAPAPVPAPVTEPVKVLGVDGVTPANTAGATAFDPPVPGAPGPFDGAPVPKAVDSPVPATAPVVTPPVVTPAA